MPGPWPRAARYLRHDLWVTDTAAYGPARRLGLQLLRLIIVAGRASQDGLLNVRAMGLVYSTLLSLVPLLAVSFSVLKAFGAHYQIGPLLEQGLAPLGPHAPELAARIVRFVANTQVGVLGAIGIAGLLYAVLSLLDKIEDALNHIWQARRGRRLARKFSDYLSLLLVGPVLVVAAFGLIATAQSHWLVQRIISITPLEPLVLFVAGQALPFALLCAAFTCLYRFMPNTEVRLSSALVGGMAAALLWHLAGVAFAAFVAGSTRYTAIYSGFAGVMVFLIWLYVGWLIVLGGGQVAYFYQYPASYVAGLTRHGSLFHEWAALAVLADITRRFLARQGPVRVAELAAATSVPVAPLQRIVDDLVSHGILLRAAEPEGVALARPPEMVTVDEALAVVSDPAGRDRDWVERGPAPVGEILRRRDGAVGEALTDLTLRSLVVPPPLEASVTDLARYRQR